MRRWFDLPAAVIASFDLLKKDDVGVLFTKEGYGTAETDLILVWIFFVPDLPVLHVKGQRAKHSSRARLVNARWRMTCSPTPRTRRRYHAQTLDDSSRRKRFARKIAKSSIPN